MKYIAMKLVQKFGAEMPQKLQTFTGSKK